MRWELPWQFRKHLRTQPLSQIHYCITTGYGRHQYTERDLQVTDLTANARGAAFLFPGAKTILDIGGQTMKASKIDARRHVQTFRLNDKCASGTGMFLEKTVRYMGFDTDDIGGLLESAEEVVPISGVCTVFAESEVINHLSNGVSPENIMFGSVMSLTQKSMQLLKRIKVEPEVTLVGGILRWETMANVLREELKVAVNVSEGDMPQFTGALGCAVPMRHEGQPQSYTGCDIPADPELVAEGWRFRCNTDDIKLGDLVDTYRELGFEVHLQPVNLSGLSSDCGGCAGMLQTFSAVYTRK